MKMTGPRGKKGPETYVGLGVGNGVAVVTLHEKVLPGRGNAGTLKRRVPGLDGLVGSQVVSFGVGDNAVNPFAEGKNLDGVGPSGDDRAGSGELGKNHSGNGGESKVDHCERRQNLKLAAEEPRKGTGLPGLEDRHFILILPWTKDP